MNIKKYIAPLLTAAFTLALVCSPDSALEAAAGAYKICENTVIPSLFPFFVCSNLLTMLNATEYLSRILKPVMRPIFGISENSALAVIMGIVSGYPIGAKTAAALKDGGMITKSEGEKLLAFCNNSGPLFILGAVGSGMLFDRQCGVVLYAAHILSAFTSALLMRRVKCEFAEKSRENPRSAQPFGTALTDSVSASMTSVYTISGFVIVSAILLKFIDSFGIFDFISVFGIKKEYAKCAVYGLIEPTNGCIAAAALKLGRLPKCMIISAIIGWSGISVHLQVSGIVKKSGLSTKYYFFGKLVSAVSSPVYTAVIYKLYRGKSPAVPIHIMPFEFAAANFAVFIAMSVILYKIFKKRKT